MWFRFTVAFAAKKVVVFNLLVKNQHNTIQQHLTLSVTVKAPPSKSQTMRAILFASLACPKDNGNQCNSIIYNYLESPDTEAMIAACRSIGAKINKRKLHQLEITGVSGKPKIPDDVIYAGNSGQVLRFIGAIAGLIDGYTVITGDYSVRNNRPVKPLLTGLMGLGAVALATKQDGCAPIIIKGPVQAGKIYIDGADSQPVSGLIFMSIFIPGVTEINVTNSGETPWVELSLSWLDKFQIKYSNYRYEKYVICNPQGTNYQLITSFDYTVPGDFSSILYLVAAAIITNKTVKINNLDFNDTQGDKQVLEVLITMGADINIYLDKVDEQYLIVNACLEGDIKNIKNEKKLVGKIIDVNNFIDALPILAVLACYAHGETRLVNAKIARSKECDRLSVITKELKKMGAEITELTDSLIIQPRILSHAVINSYNDHRIAMSMVVAALGVKNTDVDKYTIINNTECINKSYKNFIKDISLIVPGLVTESNDRI